MMRALLVAAVILLVALAGCSKAPNKEPLMLFEDIVVGENQSTLTVMWPHGGKGPSYVNWVETFRTTQSSDAIGWLAVDEDSNYADVRKSSGPYYAEGDGVRFKLFAWDSAGYLQGGMTNKTLAEATVPWVGDYYALTSPLPNYLYYLGNGTTPNGMEKLPQSVRGIASQANELLVGQPEGGVVSFKVLASDWKYGWAIGDLYIAAQISSLVQP